MNFRGNLNAETAKPLIETCRQVGKGWDHKDTGPNCKFCCFFFKNALCIKHHPVMILRIENGSRARTRKLYRSENANGDH